MGFGEKQFAEKNEAEVLSKLAEEFRSIINLANKEGGNGGEDSSFEEWLEESSSEEIE